MVGCETSGRSKELSPGSSLSNQLSTRLVAGRPKAWRESSGPFLAGMRSRVSPARWFLGELSEKKIFFVLDVTRCLASGLR